MDERLQNEIKHGCYLAQAGAGEIWNWEGSAGRRRWARRVEMLTEGLGTGLRVLELGCGTGYFTRELVCTGASVTAIDISPNLIDIAKREMPAMGIEFRVENAYATNFQECSFDVVLGSSVLHHLEPDLALQECYRVLRPGGLLRFTEPNMLNPQIAAQKKIPWLKRRLGDSPDETAFFKWGIKKKLYRAGFSEICVEPFDFLHPGLPKVGLELVEHLCLCLEYLPLFREIAGSLWIQACKPRCV